ncbi:virion structural protein [Shewanella phage FishSpeaker]|nr:virion structural protein [Shewanella phage FishSpeaker]
MSRDSINLFKKRFLEYNRVRYVEEDNWRIALESLTVDDINVLEYVPDPESKYRTVLTEVQSDKFSLTGLDQKYTKAYFGTDTVSMLSDRFIYPDLVSVLNLNILGMFFYENKEEPEFPHVVIATNFLREWSEGLPFINEVLEAINTYTKYDIKMIECTFSKNEEDSSGTREVIDVDLDNHTIWGSIKVGQIPAAYPLGTYPYEYLGKFSEFHLIEKNKLLELSNIPDSPLDEQSRLETPFVWLKFRYYGKIVYIPKYPILSGVSWNTLNDRGLVGGKTIITGLDGNEYRLRLVLVNDEENEWDNLIKRCVDGSEMMEWEAFNYSNEMQYSGAQGSTAVLTEGIDSTQQNYLVGGAGMVDLITPIAKGTTQVSNRLVSWLPVLELRGCDPIDADSVHPHWVDLKDPIPDQYDVEYELPPDMTFAIRLKKVEYEGKNLATISVEAESPSDTAIVYPTKVSVLSEIEEPDLEPVSVSAISIVYPLRVSEAALDEGVLDMSVSAVQDAYFISVDTLKEVPIGISEAVIDLPSETDATIKRTRISYLSEPTKTISEPYIK